MKTRTDGTEEGRETVTGNWKGKATGGAKKKTEVNTHETRRVAAGKTRPKRDARGAAAQPKPGSNAAAKRAGSGGGSKGEAKKRRR